MKALSYLTVSAVALSVVWVVVPIGTQAETQGNTVAKPTRLIDLIPVDEIVSISYSDGSCEIVLLDDESVQSFRNNVAHLKDRDKSATAQDQTSNDDLAAQRRRIERIESGWYDLESPWKVVLVGEDFVRLEPLVQLPRHERVSWIAIPHNSIRYVKSKK